MIDIYEYIKRPKYERQEHLKLDEPCLERGGPKVGVSSFCKGLMAHIFDTTMPSGFKVLLCHACNNDQCSNPNHLYWGTFSENCLDALANGRKTGWQHLVEKYGHDGAIKIVSSGNKAAGGKANKGKPKRK